MRPSETSRGQAWLGNFAAIDVDAATVLVDSLRLVSLSDLLRKLRGLLDMLVENDSVALPALVVPERNLRHFEELAARAEATNEESAELDSQGAQEIVAWRDFRPGAPIPVPAGSDAFVAMALAEFAPGGNRLLSHDGRWLAPNAGLGDLRDMRCRSIVVLTDYVGSGNQAETLAAAIARNPTIRSWRSLHLVQIHVAAVAAQKAGANLLDKSPAVDAFHAIETAPSIWTTIKDPLGQDAVVAFCRTYSQKAKTALGYDASGGLLVTERRAPNNLPGVFIQSPPGWSSLFPQRRVPQDFVDELRDYRPSEALEISARRMGQARIGRNERLPLYRGPSRDLLQVLVIANNGIPDSSDLAETMGLDIQDAAAYLATLREWGFLDASGRITDDGRRELLANKRGRRRTTARLAGSKENYYPVALR